MKRLAPFLVLLVAAVGWLSGCDHRAPSASAPIAQAAYDLADTVFQSALLLKPREEAGSTNLSAVLSPLFLCEMTATETNSGPRVVLFEPGETTINGRPHPQMTFVWLRTEMQTHRSRPDRDQWLGMRATLDSRNRAVIWEVLDGSTHPRVVIVTESAEARARNHFGAPLPGRRFAVEQSTNNAPDTIVARVIEDGPVAMGPIAHLAADGGLTTLICRCMTPQTVELTGTDYYELLPAPETGKPSVLLRKEGGIESRIRLSPDF
ncbi:MAG TPA: hypothetical protein PKA41_00015 [Verrucomicrobiota bacterium]|mgnify:CR=1 FL=1|nr:hypothetical protein [Verrucomicrobiota bacterium]